MVCLIQAASIAVAHLVYCQESKDDIQISTSTVVMTVKYDETSRWIMICK